MFKLVLLIVFLLWILKKKSSFTGFLQNRERPEGSLTVALVTLIYKPKDIQRWLDLHRTFGISHFYIRLEDTPELITFFQQQPDVTLLIASSEGEKNQFTSLQQRQIDTVNKVIKTCKETFLIHIDCDEVLSGNIQSIRSLPESIGTFWMQNYEAMYEHVPTETDTCFQAKKFIDCSKERCASYINGKSGCRISAPGVTMAGPHRFKSNLKDEFMKEIIVEHYESCDFGQYIKKYQRLAKNGSDLKKIPFQYYRESIEANGDTTKLEEIYKKYRVAS